MPEIFHVLIFGQGNSSKVSNNITWEACESTTSCMCVCVRVGTPWESVWELRADTLFSPSCEKTCVLVIIFLCYHVATSSHSSCSNTRSPYDSTKPEWTFLFITILPPHAKVGPTPPETISSKYNSTGSRARIKHRSPSSTLIRTLKKVHLYLSRESYNNGNFQVVSTYFESTIRRDKFDIRFLMYVPWYIRTKHQSRRWWVLIIACK